MRREKDKNRIHLIKTTVLFIGLFSFVSACDFSTHEYYSYQSNNENEDESIYLGWHFGDRCFVSAPEEIYEYDNVIAMFPSDNIPIFSERELYTEYVYDDSSQIVDSTMEWIYFLDIAIDDERIIQNDSIFVSINKGNKQLKLEILYLEKQEITFEDRIPLIRMH